MDRFLVRGVRDCERIEPMCHQRSILVAADSVSDAEHVARLLGEEYQGILTSTDSDHAVSDFESASPRVLVLAFRTLEKAEAYYLGLYRLSSCVHSLPHRALILCAKEDLQRAYDLCKRGYFDNYILFWPAPYDARRLLMEVHHSMHHPSIAEYKMDRAMLEERIAELESMLAQSLVEGSGHIDNANFAIENAECDVSSALDELSNSLNDQAGSENAEMNDYSRLQNKIDSLKEDEIKQSFESVSEAVAPVAKWAEGLRDGITNQVDAFKVLYEQSHRQKPRVLVVEDDQVQHKFITHMLMDEDIDLDFAISGSRALISLSKYRPSLILMDVDLPDMDGMEVTRRIKTYKQFSNIPVVMISGHSQKQVFVNSQRAGAEDFLVKPFVKDIFVDKLRKYLSIS